MKTRIFFTTIILFFVSQAYTQDCIYYYPQVEGAKLRYQHFDSKDKPTGKMSQELINFSTTAKGSKGEILSKMYDEEDELLNEVNLEMRCEGGKYYFDMMSYVNQETMKAFGDMDIVVDATDIEFPSTIKEGDKLSDAKIKITVNTGLFPLTATVEITDRVVESKETLTTPAGNFETYKINQTTKATFGLQLVTKSTEWYSKDVGMIKSISYKSGKPYSRTELISLER